MNQHVSVDDFGYRDFILIKAPREQVLGALKDVVLENDVDLDFEVQPWKPGLLMRLIFKIMGLGDRINDAVKETEKAANVMNAKRAAGGPIESEQVSMHTGDAALVADMTVDRGPAYSDAAIATHDIFSNDVRLWSINGSDWLLIEYKEQVSGMSMLGFSLSLQMTGVDVLFFRQSGARVSEAHYDFHIYSDGDTARRVLCHATWPHGDRAQEWWEGQSDGPLSGYEAAELYDGVTEETLLDNAKIEAILGGLALSSNVLFGSGRAVEPVLFSRRSGGVPLA